MKDRAPILPIYTPALNNGLIPRYTYDKPPEGDPAIATSMLGTPIYSNLTFLSEEVDVGNPTTVDPNAGKKDLRIDTVLFIVTQPKNIVKTPIFGRNGTVKEFISDGDYLINITGAIVSPEPTTFPIDDVDLFIRYMTLQTQLPVASFFLDLFGIHSIVIEEYEVGEKVGTRNEVPFTIRALSDEPLEFELNPNRGL